MIAYVDSSVVLRRLFGEPDALEAWSTIEVAYASCLMPVEVGRVVDRYRLMGKIGDEEVAQVHEEARRAFRSIEILALTESILERAAGPMATVVGTLDALHLATALELSRGVESPLIVATHDAQLARGSRAMGLQVAGA